MNKEDKSPSFDRLSLLNQTDRGGDYPPCPVKPAASLLILHQDKNNNLTILMGQRAKSSVFVPEKYVFPGGGIDFEDKKPGTPISLAPLTKQLLNINPPNESSTQLADQLVNCAFRETTEETGLDLTKMSLTSLIYLARAITPPKRPRRYDTYFFLCLLKGDKPETDITAHENEEFITGDWFNLKEAIQLPLHPMTRVILEDLTDLLKTHGPGLIYKLQQPNLVPLYQATHQQYSRTTLTPLKID